LLEHLTSDVRLLARSVRDGTRPVPVAGLTPGEAVRVRRGRSVLEARIVDRFDAWALRDQCRDRVTEALRDAGIAHVQLDAVREEPHRVVVASSDIEALRATLSVLGTERRLHLARITSRGAGPARALPRLPGIRSGDVLRVFSPQVSVTGRLLPTMALGVDIEIWERIRTSRASPDGRMLPAGSLVAPRTNPRTRTLTPQELAAAQADRRGQSPPLEQVTFPVDVVYTWVDSSDPAWRADFDARRAGDSLAGSHASAWSPARFTSREELRYSLRSLVAHANWVRRIHVVTSGQVPHWLDTSHPQINVVRHDEIFPDPDDLPTFNSHAIEACLHRIPGLSEHYVYFNDDVFLARPLRPEDFFGAGGDIRYFPSRIPIDDELPSDVDLPVVSAFKNGRRVIERHFARRPMTRPRHTPHPQHRGVIEEIERAEPELVARTRRARFRSATDISLAAQLQSSWAAATGRGVATDTSYEFIDIWSPDVDARINRLLLRDDVDFYCLNETWIDPEQCETADARVARVLKMLLPFASPFETDVRSEPR